MAETISIEEFGAYLAGFVARLEPGQRKKMGLRIAAHLQRARSKTIGANVDPDGRPFEPRKPRRPLRGAAKVEKRKRSIKDRKMFLRARTAKLLRKQATADEASVGYTGAVGRIMRVHQEGLKDHVERDRSSPVVQYPVRRLLGMNETDQEAILDIVLASLSE
jgi:phage virion morphogenesis protein